MGKWIILIGDSNNTISRYEKMIFLGSEKIIKTAHYIDIYYENDHYAQFLDDDDELIIGDYEKAELEKLPFGNIKMVMLKYSDIDILKKIVSADDFPKDIIIDCDGVDLGLENIIDRKRLLL
ncbi:MAG: hypothetical protein NC079_11820 [Clostridium sp.]|nr:hypothetical protein [Acetatifactor muris]MCM1528065.1 hypothetical protein [Bacteroides sp.]MCM1564277.1 hypothetical protein [Clostridium sp.]